MLTQTRPTYPAKLLRVEIMVAAGRAVGRAWASWAGPVERMSFEAVGDNVAALRAMLEMLIVRAERTQEGGDLFERDPKWHSIKSKEMFEDLRDHAIYLEFISETSNVQLTMYSGRHQVHHLWTMPWMASAAQCPPATDFHSHSVALASMAKHLVLSWLDAGERGELKEGEL